MMDTDIGRGLGRSTFAGTLAIAIAAVALTVDVQICLHGTATEPVVDTFAPAAARYVRLTVTGAQGIRSPEITEFRISAATSATAKETIP